MRTYQFLCLCIVAMIATALFGARATWAEESPEPTCPDGARLVEHEGTPMCAWESDLQPPLSSPSDPDVDPDYFNICLVIYIPVWDLWFELWWCIDIERLFAPTYPPPEPEKRYYAGTCEKGLGPFEEPIGIIRHDDVEGYVKIGDDEYEEQWTSGFFAENMAAALFSAHAYFASNFGLVIYVDGEEIHTASSSCTLPEVTKARYDDLDAKRYQMGWTEYHLIVKNCQIWAAAVMAQ